MADESRQSKLASAKKKLKEFQQKNSPATAPGAKKKKKAKDGSRPDTPTGDGQSPDSAYLDSEVANYNAEQLASEALSSSNSLTNSSSLTPHMGSTPPVDTLLQVPDQVNESATDNNRALSSTESLRQLSEQLNGLVTQSTSYINGESAISATNAKELETRYQELALALDTSNLTNKQLSTKIDELKRSNQELGDQLQKERKDAEQKFVKEHGAMREQLQVHIQTIGILVSEKSELQTALSYTQQAARQKAAEVEDQSKQLQSSRQRIAELERTLSSVSTQQKQFDKHNKELEKDRDNLKMEVYKLSKLSEEVKQQNSEMSEQLRSRVSENAAMKLDLEDLHKKLEMAEVMIQQFSSQSGLPDTNQQLQMALEEKAQQQAQIAQLSESVQQLHAERDQYVQKLHEEGSIWQQRVQQLSAQVHALLEEKERYAAQIQELETSLSELQNKSALQSTETECSAPVQLQGPTETELALQEEIQKLQEEKEAVSAQYQAQVRDNQQLSRLNQEQEERLLELEKTVQRYNEEIVDRQQILENMQSDKITISRALAQNRELKEQLAELQNGFVKLTNENMELVSALQSEQHLKKEVGRKMAQMQEDLVQLKEEMEVKAQQLKELQEQRDQYYIQLQQYTAAYQQLVTEREELHRQYLQQVQLMDQLQHEEVQGKISIEIHQKELTLAKEKLEALTKENEEMKHAIGLMAAELETGTLPRMQGDGVENEGLVRESLQKTAITIPEDFESREEMVAFLTSAMSQLEKERDEIGQHMIEQRQQHQDLLQQLSALKTRQQKETEVSAGYNTDTIPVEVHEAMKAAMEKLQFRFTALMQEKVELKERVEELEHRCIQLSGETDTIGEYIALYQSQRAVLKQRHREKDDYINRLAQDKEEMKMKLAELQELVMRLVSERNEWYSKYVSAVQNPDLLSNEISQNTTPAERRIELNATDGEEMPEISLLDEPEQEVAIKRTSSSSGSNKTPPPGTQGHPPSGDLTAKQIMQLLQEIQNPQARQSSFLGENPCIPFFYRADENDEVRIMVI